MFATSAQNEREAEDELFVYVANALLHDNLSPSVRSATYIPASRSGLVLSLEYIASSLFQELGIAQEEKYNSKFTRPVISFLRSLVQTPNKRGLGSQRSDVVDFLEKGILKGSVDREDGPFPSFFYTPSSSGKRLPMHAVSSMVTEMTPVIDRLRNSYSMGAIIFEEPEAHLHLSAQREMARAIVRIVNSGIPIVLTTHSDTFLQEINFLIQLSSPENKNDLVAQFGYDDIDTIPIEDVIAYEFHEGEGGTHVLPAPATESGFVIETLNQVLFDISKQALALEDD